MIAALTETRDIDDLQTWVTQFGLTHPVGADDDWDVWDRFHQVDGRPQYLVIDRDLTLLYGGLNRLTADEAALGAL